MNKDKLIKIITLFVSVFIIVSLLFAVYMSGSEALKIRKYNDVYEVNVYGISGYESDNNSYLSINSDPSITVSYTPSDALILDLDFKDDQEQYGQIYYAMQPDQFEEKYSYPYVFREGSNVIDIDAENAEFLRIDITDLEGVSFDMVSMKELSSQAYSIHYTNLIKIFIISAIITAVAWAYGNGKTSDRKKDIFFAGLLGVSLLIIFKDFIVGDAYYMYSDVGSDTVKQYYPYYVNEVLSIRDGSFSVWNWDYGLGTCILNMNAWTMDPFGIFIVLVGVIFGPGSVHHMLIWSQILKIITIYILGRKYFKILGFNTAPSDIAAYFLALNGYVMLWGQHPFMGTAMVYLILMLLAVEKALQDSKHTINLYLVLSVAATLIFSYYFGYMILIVAAIYFIVRYIMANRIRSRKALIDCGRIALSVTLGMMLSCVVFLPACYYMVTISADRMNPEDADKFTRFCLNLFQYDQGMTLERLSRMISNNSIAVMRGGNSAFANAFEAPQYFVNVLSFFFIGQWFTDKMKNTRSIKQIFITLSTVILVGLLMLNNASGYLFNGFSYVSFRCVFLSIPFVAACIASVLECLEKDGKINPYGIILGCLGSWLSWDYAYSHCSAEVKDYVVFLGFVLVLGTIILILSNLQKYKHCLCVVLLVLMVSVSIADARITSTRRQYVTAGDYAITWKANEMDGSTATALDWLRSQDTSFYRVSKTYSEWYDVSDSFMEQYSTGVWYNSTPNTNVISFYETAYPSAMTGDYFIKIFDLSTNLAEEANDILHTKYLLSKREINSSNWTEINRFNEVIVYRNQDSDSIAKWYTNTISESDFALMDDEQKADVLNSTAITDITSPVILAGTCEETQPMTLIDQTHMLGVYRCDGTGILMIAIPYQDGWSIYVDGKKAENFKCDYGFYGIGLGSGEHVVEARYALPYLKEGAMISFAGVIVVSSIMVFDKCRKKKNHLVKTVEG